VDAGIETELANSDVVSSRGRLPHPGFLRGDVFSLRAGLVVAQKDTGAAWNRNLLIRSNPL
jgi:hypothetical protein